MAVKPLKGYKRLPGSARKYLTPSGVRISEYEYRSRQVRRYRDAEGNRLIDNYSQLQRFRQTQDYAELRFKLRSIDSTLRLPGSELELAMFEVYYRDPRAGVVGYWQERARGRAGPPKEGEDRVPLPVDEVRLAKLIAALGAPDYYFWRFWYSETRST